MRITRKLICILIALVLVAGMIPVALADDEPVADFGTFKTKVGTESVTSVKLTADLTATDDIQISHTMTIKLNGHTINEGKKVSWCRGEP